MSSSEREAFEDYIRTKPHFKGTLDLDEYGEYKWFDVREQWEAWQAARRAQASAEPVGEAGTMPGTTGFTMACFHADKVPFGSKLYAAPQPALPSSYTDSQLLTRGDAVRVTFAFSDIAQATEWHARITGRGALAREGE